MKEKKFKGLYETTNNGKRYWEEYGICGKPGLIGACWIIEDLQFIGREDKDGKEIYESDLVEYPITSFPLEVIWDDFSCGFMLRNAKGALSKMPSEETMAEYSINIGNIYSNPELLEVK